jgi:hypothetical protein
MRLSEANEQSETCQFLEMRLSEANEQCETCQFLEIFQGYRKLEAPLPMPDCSDGEKFTRFRDLKFL